MNKCLKLWPVVWLLPATLFAQIPPPVLPEGVGVNIHFTRGRLHDLDMIAAAGFKIVRMDFSWERTEPSPGTYDWSVYDELTDHLRQRGLRAMYILDYSHPAYEQKIEGQTSSPRHSESVAAFARWAAAAAKHFHKQHIIWEIYNEPNGSFWKPKANADEYTALALATSKAIREAEPSATIIGPAMAGFDWPFMGTFLESGVLQYIDAVSVHPYRNRDTPPETVASEYKKLREWIDRSAPKSKQGKIPIISGEWGYFSNRKGVSLDTQAAFAVRQQLVNLLNGVPISIWYDWKNDGVDPNDIEHNFGTVASDLTPKPAYLALQAMTRELAGYKIERRIDDYGDKDFVLLLSKRHSPQKVAAWTLGASHSVHLLLNHDAANPDEIVLDLGSLPKYVSLGKVRLK